MPIQDRMLRVAATAIFLGIGATSAVGAVFQYTYRGQPFDAEDLWGPGYIIGSVIGKRLEYSFTWPALMPNARTYVPDDRSSATFGELVLASPSFHFLDTNAAEEIIYVVIDTDADGHIVDWSFRYRKGSGVDVGEITSTASHDRFHTFFEYYHPVEDADCLGNWWCYSADEVTATSSAPGTWDVQRLPSAVPVFGSLPFLVTGIGAVVAARRYRVAA